MVEKDPRKVGMKYLSFAKKHKKYYNLKSEKLGIEIPKTKSRKRKFSSKRQKGKNKKM